MTILPVARKSGGLLRFLFLLLLLAAVIAVFLVFAAPWAFYMGGRFHAIPMWQGLGRIHSNSAGGDYMLYVWFWPDSGRLRGLVYVKGNARLCTPTGENFNLTLGGNFDKPAAVDLNGQRVSLYMHNLSVVDRNLGRDLAPHLELRGKWNNPDLVLDDQGSIARSFGGDAKLYPPHASRPYMGEVSPVTLHQGGNSDFEAACAAGKK